ncbi:energy transducer TonB [Winogradskyella sp. 3972H.M.0a.05]|uniref:energy transducer TonB n=1 Tax=Winogradskyella sp. 3972H.M.0a.05 TaxID=2950277 RepID=UPI003399B550
MKKIKNSHSNAGQSTTEVRKPHKHDANVQKNTTLYFQVGLILCLLAVHTLFEMQFQTKIPKYVETAQVAEGNFETPPEKFKRYVEPVKEPKPVKKQKKKLVTDKIKRVDDDHKIIETTIITQDQNTTDKPPVKIDEVNPFTVEDEAPIPFYKVEKVPVFPGCEKSKTNAERRQCMTKKLNKFILRKFNSDIASEYGLSGIQKIDVQFKIDKNGQVTDILTRAPHPALEKEARRVINKIPKMTPGTQQGKPVGVTYLQPIKFRVQD